MKNILLIVCVLLLASPCLASPFLVSDPSSEVIGGYFEIYEGPAGLTTTASILLQGTKIADQANQSDGSVKFDCVSVAVGMHNWYVRYYIEDSVWGRSESIFVPFDFARPGLVDGPSGLRLVK